MPNGFEKSCKKKSGPLFTHRRACFFKGAIVGSEDPGTTMIGGDNTIGHHAVVGACGQVWQTEPGRLRRKQQILQSLNICLCKWQCILLYQMRKGKRKGINSTFSTSRPPGLARDKYKIGVYTDLMLLQLLTCRILSIQKGQSAS